MVPFAGDPPVEEISHTGIGEKGQGPGVMAMDDAVANNWGREEAGEGEQVGDGVDVLMCGGEQGKDFA